MKLSRRNFLKSTVYGSAATSIPLTLSLPSSALANTEGDYKALVCLFLFGGNDSFNMLIPDSGENLDNYRNARPAIQLWDHEKATLGKLLDDQQNNLVLNGAMPKIASLFEEKVATSVVNVGTLLEPTTKANYGNVARSPNLGAHNKQQLAWQRGWGTRQYHPYGWAGMMMDILASGAETISPNMSFSGNELMNGQGIQDLRVSASGIRAMSSLAVNSVNNNIGKLLADNNASAFGRAYLQRFQDILDFQTTLGDMLEQHPEDPTIPAGYLGGQFKMVKRLIQASQGLNQSRQVYFISMGGFDNHSNQRGKHDGLLATIDDALSAFYASLQADGLEDSVTTFTMSDFGRTIENNSNQGTDHGWGSNQLVIGGSVKGGKAYGRYPTFVKDGPDAVGNKFIPTTASEQYAATLCRWFGLSDAGIDYIFPTLSPDNDNPFPSRYLSFLGSDLAQSQRLDIAQVSASETRVDHTPQMAIDGDPTTKWTAKGLGIQFDITLKNLAMVNVLRVSQAKGDVRQYLMDISVSGDGVTFTPLLSYLSPGNSTGFVDIDLGTQEAKIIRLTCNGNNDSVNAGLVRWNNFQEIEVWGITQ
ncbi:DUF1501 domain-containing protein [Vibrio sp. ZSDZ65]|uniref:DUF1501 domain-containing protein n=1 Tax=Vibrio qingdaonensis TaxID=2829491 RepID=A0A9X3CQI9_9VIBR|nr:DUF1501 domain-containing protein [Vibrio qingdaonensis]MCW8346815.1 DUF1501 domain-containing protein [Vibrio qingdaonensis]